MAARWLRLRQAQANRALQFCFSVSAHLAARYTDLEWNDLQYKLTFMTLKDHFYNNDK